MRARFDFERVEAFGVAVEAVALMDELADELPDRRAYIRDQLRRAANSVALNIAEGAGEFSPEEKERFYRMARRSATECAGQVVVCRRLGLAEDSRTEEALDVLARVVGMLVTLIRSCNARRRLPVRVPSSLTK
ncbi:MAG: four helix bundle protein [Myxococcales bacterium]|nr:four helix bundle protein [Myxococcales bacterium]